MAPKATAVPKSKATAKAKATVRTKGLLKRVPDQPIGLDSKRAKLALQLAKMEAEEKEKEEADKYENWIREIVEELRACPEKTERAHKMVMGDFLLSGGNEEIAQCSIDRQRARGEGEGIQRRPLAG